MPLFLIQRRPKTARPRPGPRRVASRGIPAKPRQVFLGGIGTNHVGTMCHVAVGDCRRGLLGWRGLSNRRGCGRRIGPIGRRCRAGRTGHAGSHHRWRDHAGCPARPGWLGHGSTRGCGPRKVPPARFGCRGLCGRLGGRVVHETYGGGQLFVGARRTIRGCAYGADSAFEFQEASADTSGPSRSTATTARATSAYRACATIPRGNIACHVSFTSHP